MAFDDFQRIDLPALLDYLREFWLREAKTRTEGLVAPPRVEWQLAPIQSEPLPLDPQPLSRILPEIDNSIVPNAVKTSHPLFLAYVTPPSLDICALGDAITALLNQNVSFESLSPAGTAIERTVIRWLANIIGYGPDAGGILLGGGSQANMYGLALGRHFALRSSGGPDSNPPSPQQLRVYCSEYVHRSVHKAATFLGIGSRNVVTIPADVNHQVRVDLLEEQIRCDLAAPDRRYLPATIVGAAGTRLACAFDDLRALAELAERYHLWLHVDAAYGGFLRLASPPPPALADLHLAHSITIDPHKLLFVPFDSGCILVQDRQHLQRTFGTEGEYLEPSQSDSNFAELGMELGRSMRALKVWLALKYVGARRYGDEFSRLLALARYLEDALANDPRFELLAPVAGTVVCFRWRGARTRNPFLLNALNRTIRMELLQRGTAYLNEVQVRDHVGLRVCFTNYRTTEAHVDELIAHIVRCALECDGDKG